MEYIFNSLHVIVICIVFLIVTEQPQMMIVFIVRCLRYCIAAEQLDSLHNIFVLKSAREMENADVSNIIAGCFVRS